jgi:hypothetical protein
MHIAGLKSADDVTKETKPYRIEKDNEDLEKVIEGIEGTMNPFILEPEESLYCLTSGKKVDDGIKEDLLECVTKGATWCDEFRNGCFQDPKRFEKPIPRRKVWNFACSAVKGKHTCKDMKVKELQGTRDLFGRLLFISTL